MATASDVDAGRGQVLLVSGHQFDRRDASLSFDLAVWMPVRSREEMPTRSGIGVSFPREPFIRTCEPLHLI